MNSYFPSIRISAKVLGLCFLIFASIFRPAVAQDDQPNVRENMPMKIYCRREFNERNEPIQPPMVLTANGEEIACNTENLVATGEVRKNNRGYWLIAMRRGDGIVEVPANNVGSLSSIDLDLKGKNFSVSEVEFLDWLRLRTAPAPFAEFVSGIPRMQDNLRATGRVATWKQARWIEIEYIANLGWVRTTNLRDAEPQELIFSNTRTIIGWVNARYVKKIATFIPPEIERGAFFGSERLENSASVTDQKKLLSEFGYRDSEGKYWRVPAGYVTDGASIPRSLWSIVGTPYDEDYLRAAIVHDYFCDVRRRTWRDTHRVFYEALQANGVSSIKAYSMYFAVYRFGPRWIEQRVQCLYVCAEHGEVAARLKPQFDESDWQEGRHAAENSSVTLEELERLADRQLREPDTKVSFEISTLSPIGYVQTHNLPSVSIHELAAANQDTGYMVEGQLLDGELFDKVHKDKEYQGVIGPRR